MDSLERDLRLDHLRRKRVVAVLYGTLATFGGIAWLWTFWPASFGVIRLHIRWTGSDLGGWIYIVAGAAVLFGIAIVQLRRFAAATAEIRKLQP